VPAWIWFLTGIVLIILEIFVSTFFIIWFGISALLVSLLVWTGVLASLSLQILCWSIMSVILLFIWFRFYRDKRIYRELSGLSEGELLNERGVISKRVFPGGTGKVRLYKVVYGIEEWECVSDVEIDVAAQVRVVGIEGNRLRVSE
jgi:membrane protein implicated in regulation of membrane protease activity